MPQNCSSICALFRNSTIFLIVFCFCAILVRANIFDKKTVSDNENKAVELGKVWELNSIKQAVNLYIHTADDWEKLKEPKRAVFCLTETAKMVHMYSDYETAFRVLEKAIKLATYHNLPEEKIITSSLYSLYALEKSDKKNAQKYSEQSFSLNKKITSTKATAYSFFCKGMYEYYYGKMKDATDFFEQASVSAQETQDIFIMSQTLYYVGFSYLRDGNPYRAVDKMDLALQQCEKYNYRKGIALSYFGKAYLNFYINEKQTALDLFRKSDLLFPTDFEWMEKARIVTAIGLIYMEFGEFEIAESKFQKAIVYYEKANYLLGKISNITLLGDTYLLKSDLKRAKQAYESATTLSSQIDDKFRVANIKEGLGNVEFRENNFDAAIKNYFEALKIYNNIGVKLPVIENLIGNAHKQKRDYKAARNYYNSALQTNRETKDFLQLSEVLFSSATLNLIENKPDEAFNNIKESISLTENRYSDVANTNLKSTYLSSVFERYELFINLSMNKHRQNPNEKFDFQALQSAEKSRARVMMENLSLANTDFTKVADAETVKREKEIRVLLNVRADKLTDLLTNNADKSETDKISNEINELENELEEIKADLKQNSPIYSAIKNPPPFDVSEFQRNVLDEESLLLEFSFGKEESYLWLIGKNEFSSYVLPPREQIETKIQTLRELLASREMVKDESIETYQTRITKAEEDYRKTAKELSLDLFGQVADKFGGKRLIIVPDGKLGYFPVSALPLPNSENNEPILLSNEVVYEPSASTLSVLAGNSKQANQASKSLLIFSDPVFTSDDTRLSSADKNELSAQQSTEEKFRFVESLDSLVRLDSSKTEADSIVNIVGNSNADNFSGFAANREKLLNINAADYKILHFATHGLIDEKRPELSGIVLSRFDENGQKLEEFFRLHDIYGMNLNSDLVVLSACNTGIGKEVKGEGLMSLNNAFLSVGAKSVMASLWKVEDQATLELMKDFYGAMVNEKLTPSKALRKAQIKMLRDGRYRSPFYWAAFTVHGDFKNVPEVSRGFGWWSYFLPFGLILGLGFVLSFRFIRQRNCMSSPNSHFSH